MDNTKVIEHVYDGTYTFVRVQATMAIGKEKPVVLTEVGFAKRSSADVSNEMLGYELAKSRAVAKIRARREQIKSHLREDRRESLRLAQKEQVRAARKAVTEAARRIADKRFAQVDAKDQTISAS